MDQKGLRLVKLGDLRYRAVGDTRRRGPTRRFLSASSMDDVSPETSALRVGALEEVGAAPSHHLGASTPQLHLTQRPLTLSRLTLSPHHAPPDHQPHAAHFLHLARRTRMIYEDEELLDVTLKVNSVEIHAHRLVLAAASDYFLRMFTGVLIGGGMVEKTKTVVEMKDIDAQALRSLVDYCYTGVVSISEDNVEALFSAASMIGMGKVEELCADFLNSRLTETNALGIRRFADIHGSRRLQDQANLFITRRFLAVAESSDFVDLEPRELGPLLDSDDLNIESELDVFNALMRWYKADAGTREEALGSLLQCIRLVQLPRDVLVELHEREPIFRDHPDCHDLYVEALKTHLTPEKRTSLLPASQRLKARKSTVGYLYAFGGQDHSKGPMTIERYDPREDAWTAVGRINGRRQQFGVAVGPLYAVGGHDGWSYLASVERWDPEQNVWTRVADMGCARSTAAVAVLNGRLYVGGGRDSSHPLDSVEAYNPHTVAQPPPYSPVEAGVVENTWSQCGRMMKRRSSLAMCAAKGFLWVLGGVETQTPSPNPPASRLHSLERYDPERDEWAIVSAGMSIGREGMGIGVLGDLIFAVGGYDGSRFLTTVEAYDIPTNTWRKWRDLETGRTGTGCVVLPKYLRRPSSSPHRAQPRS